MNLNHNIKIILEQIDNEEMNLKFNSVSKMVDFIIEYFEGKSRKETKKLFKSINDITADKK